MRQKQEIVKRKLSSTVTQSSWQTGHCSLFRSRPSLPVVSLKLLTSSALDPNTEALWRTNADAGIIQTNNQINQNSSIHKHPTKKNYHQYVKHQKLNASSILETSAKKKQKKKTAKRNNLHFPYSTTFHWFSKVFILKSSIPETENQHEFYKKKEKKKLISRKRNRKKYI